MDNVTDLVDVNSLAYFEDNVYPLVNVSYVDLSFLLTYFIKTSVDYFWSILSNDFVCAGISIKSKTTRDTKTHITCIILLL